MKKIFLILFCLYSFMSYAEDTIDIVAVVNDDVITNADMKERLTLAIKSSGFKDTPEVVQKIYPQVLRLLIDEKLYEQEGKRLGLSVSENDLNRAIASLESKNQLAPGQFPNFLAEKDISFNALKKQLIGQLYWHKIIESQIRSNTNVSEKEIEEAMENISNNSDKNAVMMELNLSEIVLPVNKPSEEKTIRASAEKIVSELRKGKDFSLVATELSRSTSASKGGNIGWIQAKQLPEDLLSSIRDMSSGQISNPIKMPDGYYIIKMNKKRAMITANEKETEVGIKHAFVPLDNKLTSTEKEKLIGKIQVERTSVKSCSDFDNFAKRINSTIDSKMIMTQVKQLNDEIRSVVEKTEVGSITPVIKSSSGAHVIAVCEKTRAQKTIAAQNKIVDMLKMKKLDLQQKRYLQNLHRKSFIEYRVNPSENHQ